MKIGILAIGAELLSGNTINTNAAFISRKLISSGYLIAWHKSIGDGFDTLKEMLTEAFEDVDLVILTGGLGPTCDDMTRQALASVTGKKLVFNPEVATYIESRLGKIASLQDQANQPEGAHIFLNPNGTAPGFALTVETKMCIAMPGVPREMEPLFVEQVLPFIQARFPLPVKYYEEKIHLMLATESMVDPYLRKVEEEFPEIQIGIYCEPGTLAIHLGIEDMDEKRAKEVLAKPKKRLEDVFKKHLYVSSTGDLAESVHKAMLLRKCTLSVAESCTGGALSAKLVHLAGASNYFLGGVVAYDNSVKEEVLGVPALLIATEGAVSEPVVAAMAKGVMDATSSDYSLAISGIAGPSGGSDQKPVGSVCGAILVKGGKPRTFSFQAYGGTREMIIQHSVNRMLSELLITLQI